MKPYLLVSGDFVKTGGMDRANFALADYLARRGHEVHLVAHRVSEKLMAARRVHLHRSPKLAGSYFVSGPLLDRLGRRWARRILQGDGTVLVNGGNCQAEDANWVHYVHAAYCPDPRRISVRAAARQLRHRLYCSQERHALQRARIIIANSERTRRDLIERLDIPSARIRVVYYGTDPSLFRPACAGEREQLRKKLGWSGDRPVVVFVGAPGDRRKGFDVLLKAWQILCSRSAWDVKLAIVGAGKGRLTSRHQVAPTNLAESLQFLGFRRDVPDILRAADALVAPSRYEAYGLAVQEAICCGLPAVVSAAAGLAERYPPALKGLLVSRPEDAEEVARRIHSWREQAWAHKTAIDAFGEELRAWTWDDMAARIQEAIAA